MRIQVLVIERQDWGSEALAVVDEYTMDSNPAWWPEEQERALKAAELSHGEMLGKAILEINLPDDVVQDALRTVYQVTPSSVTDVSKDS